MRGSLILALAAALTAGCQPSLELTPQQRNIQADIIGDRIGDWAQALNNRELETAIGMYEQSESVLAIWPDGSRAQGFEQNQQTVNDLYSMIQFLSFGPQNINVDVLSGRAAVATFRFSMDVVFNDTSRDPYSGQATLVWIRANAGGDWLIRYQQLMRNVR